MITWQKVRVVLWSSVRKKLRTSPQWFFCWYFISERGRRDTSPRLFFADGQGNQWKTEIFYFSVRYSETKRDIGMGHKRWKGRYTCGNRGLLGKSWLRCSFDLVLVVRSRLRATKCDPLAKIWGVKKSVSSTIFEIELANLNHFFP